MRNSKTNTGFKGVSEVKRTKSKNPSYEAYVMIEGKRIYIKSSKTIQQAVINRTEYITNLL